MRRPDRHDFSCLLAWLLCALLYFWVAEGLSDWGTRGVGAKNQIQQNHYELLVDGFLSGHLSLAQDPSPGLLALPDPYDPLQNALYRLHDASLYRGKYYLYFGPTPALLLMLPWKVVTGHHLPQWAAAAGFAAAGLLALALLLGEIRRRVFPQGTPGALFFAVLVAGHVSWLPVILERAAFWELPIVAAAALFWWSVFFLWRYHASGMKPRWGVAAGIALVFLLGSRPSYAPAVAVLALLFALPWERRLPLATYLARLGPVVIPLAVGGTGLLLYNYERFDRIFEFGQRYVLWGADYRGVPLFSPRYIGVNAWLYFLTLPDFSPYFPFLRVPWFDDLPAGYLLTEEVPGLLFTLPILFFAGATAVQEVYRNRHDPAQRPLRYVLGAAAAGSALTGGVLLGFAGSCSRYVTELLAGWTIATAVGVLTVFTPGVQTGLRRWSRWWIGGAAVWSMACVWLASFAFQGLARFNHPVAYRRAAELLNYPSEWIARASGKKFGPVELDVHLSETNAGGWAVLLASGRPDMLNRLMLDRPAPGKVRLRLTVNNLEVVKTPVLDCAGPVLQVVCEAPWLYPPSAHPYWNAYTDNDDRLRRQYVCTIGVNGQRYSAQSIWIVDPIAFAPLVRDAATRPAACAWVDQLRWIETGPPRSRR